MAKASDSNLPTFRAAELGAILARHYPDALPWVIARVVHDMQRAARSAVRYEASRCNYPMSKEQTERGYNRLRRMESDINGALYHATLTERCTQAAHPSPATVRLGGDPRGACAQLEIPGSRGDGWGDGFAIY